MVRQAERDLDLHGLVVCRIRVAKVERALGQRSDVRSGPVALLDLVANDVLRSRGTCFPVELRRAVADDRVLDLARVLGREHHTQVVLAGLCGQTLQALFARRGFLARDKVLRLINH